MLEATLCGMAGILGGLHMEAQGMSSRMLQIAEAFLEVRQDIYCQAYDCFEVDMREQIKRISEGLHSSLLHHRPFASLLVLSLSRCLGPWRPT